VTSEVARWLSECLVHRSHRHARRKDRLEHTSGLRRFIFIYDIQLAVADKATVPINYESRISKLSLNAAELPKLDAEFEKITEGEEHKREGMCREKVFAQAPPFFDGVRP
jgi:type I site-specific restriction-modification system R (restriction) subunit